LHKKYAPSEAAFDVVFTHCTIIWEIAEQLIERSDLAIDADLVKVGCLLHDIGVYRLYLPNGEIDHGNYITHGVRGHEILEQEGFSERVCRIASCHTGVGLTRQNIREQGLPLPDRDFVAGSIEERLVMYADKFNSKNPPRFSSYETYREFTKRFGPANEERFAQLGQEFGEPDLTQLAKRYNLEIV
jgi:uncharacterized protein